MDRASVPRLDEAAWLKRPQTQAVFKALEAGGYAARAVGGAVRNALIGHPVVDVDIATTAPPTEVIRAAEAVGLKVVPTGVQHGTVTVIADHTPFEVTTLREDVETFGRHAKVAFTEDWAADARRRDFTMNALYCDAQGTVHDPLGGYADLLARKVRFIGDATERIREDYLRILRFFRLSAQYADGDLDAEGLAAAVRERDGLTRLSGERVRQEMLRLLVAPRAVDALASMYDHGLLTAILPVAPRPVFVARLAAVEAVLGLAPNPMLRIAALGVEVAEDAERLRDRLRLSTSEFQLLERASASGHLLPGTEESLARVRLYRLGAEQMREHLLLGWARAAINPADAAGRALFALPDRWQPPEFPLTGADVLAAGVAPGPRVGQILRTLEENWIAAGFPHGRAELDMQLSQLAKSDVGA